MDGNDDIKAALGELKDAAGVVGDLKTQVTKLASRLDAEKREREELELRLSRPHFGGGRSTDGDLAGERKALGLFVRTGDAAELKAMSVGSDPDGGYTVVPALSSSINSKIFDRSPMARLARRVVIESGDAFEEPVDADEIGANWVGETQSRSVTDTPELRLLRVDLHEIAAMPMVTQKLLDTSRFDIGAWLEGRLADRFARVEGDAFINGNGVGQPEGLLNYSTATTADGTRDWFTIQHVATGTSGAFAASNPADKLVDLIYALRAPYRSNARWLMNLATAGVVRKMKDEEGRYLWVDGIAAGEPARLLGFPVEIDESMPNIGANSLSIVFGDFRAAYTVVERPGLKMLRDPFTSKPNVLFYCYRRIGGGLANGEAVKFLKFGTS